MPFLSEFYLLARNVPRYLYFSYLSPKAQTRFDLFFSPLYLSLILSPFLSLLSLPSSLSVFKFRYMVHLDSLRQ